MEGITLLIPGLLTGFAALIAALAALFKRDTKNQKNTEVSNEAVDVIEKIVDGQSHINQMLLDRIKAQDEAYIKQTLELDAVRRELHEIRRGESV